MLAVAMAAQVGCEHAIAIGERGRDEVPPVRMRRAAVQEHDHRAVGPTPREGVQHEPVHAHLRMLGSRRRVFHAAEA